MIYLPLALLLAIPWIAMLFPVWRDAINCWLRGSPIRQVLVSPSGIALQFALTTLIAVVGLSARSKPFGTWLETAAFWPLYAPFFAMWAWATFYSSLTLPLLAGLSTSAALAWTLITRTTGWIHLIWPTAAVAVFSVVFLAAGQLQFHHDVRSAAEALGAKCLEAGSFRDAVSAGLNFQRSSLYAAARNAEDIYGWSFRKRDFYKVPEDAKRYVRSHRSPSFESPLPPCWPLPHPPSRTQIRR
jgi:hypothetical protein